MTENEDIVRGLVEEAVTHFRAALASDRPVILAVLGLDALARAAAVHSDLQGLAPDETRQAPALIFAVAPLVSEAVAGSIAAERVYFGLGCANALLTVQPDRFHTDRLLYVGLLLADLRSRLCRTELARRGDPLMRSVRAQRAWDATPPPDTSLQ